jgi:hypothetical protein
MSTSFGVHPFLEKRFADGGDQGAKFDNGLVLPRLEIEIVGGAPTSFDCRTNHRPAEPLSKIGKGLGEAEPQGLGRLASRIDSPHASKAL